MSKFYWKTFTELSGHLVSYVSTRLLNIIKAIRKIKWEQRLQFKVSRVKRTKVIIVIVICFILFRIIFLYFSTHIFLFICYISLLYYFKERSDKQSIFYASSASSSLSLSSYEATSHSRECSCYQLTSFSCHCNRSIISHSFSSNLHHNEINSPSSARKTSSKWWSKSYSSPSRASIGSCCPYTSQWIIIIIMANLQQNSLTN